MYPIFEILKVFLLFLTSAATAFTPITFQNSITLDKAFKHLQDVDWLGCFQQCHLLPECVSYNFCSQDGSDSICELNSCGFTKACDAKQDLIYSPRCFFHQIREHSATGGTCNHVSKTITTENNKNEVVGNFTCSQFMSVYADGHLVTLASGGTAGSPAKEIGCQTSETHRPVVLIFPKHHSVIAVEVLNMKGVAMFRGAMPPDVVTNKDRWRCNSTHIDDWYLKDFDDTHWDMAKEINFVTTTQDIPDKAKWIRPSGTNNPIYCRFSRHNKL